MSKYIVLEVQTYDNGAIGTLLNDYEDRADAESKYHLVLSAAAVSPLPIHSCVLMTNEGFFLESKAYKHTIPTPEEETPEEETPEEENTENEEPVVEG